MCTACGAVKQSAVALPDALSQLQCCCPPSLSTTPQASPHLNVLERKRAKSPGRGGTGLLEPPLPEPLSAPMDRLCASVRPLGRCTGEAAGGGEAPRSEEAPQDEPGAPVPAEVAMYGVPLSVRPRAPARGTGSERGTARPKPKAAAAAVAPPTAASAARGAGMRGEAWLKMSSTAAGPCSGATASRRPARECPPAPRPGTVML